MNHPLISVILPLYNENLSLAIQAIDSILSQTYRNIEIIIILDNPHNQDLSNLVNEYNKKDIRIKKHINNKNLGLPKTLNIGIDLANGDYIARMDGDDISDINRLETQINFLLNNPNIDLVGSDAYIINENNEIIGEYHKLNTDFAQKYMLKHFTINLIHPTWLGKTELFRTIKYRNFSHCEDYDFMLRAYALNYKFYSIPHKLLSYRILQNSLSSISRKYAYEQFVNTLRARKQFHIFIKDKNTDYPALPILTYNTIDKEKYQSTLIQLNELRIAYSNKNIFKCISLFFKISLRDIRPLTFRIKGIFLFKILHIAEFFIPKLK